MIAAVAVQEVKHRVASTWDHISARQNYTVRKNSAGQLALQVYVLNANAVKADEIEDGEDNDERQDQD